MNTTTIRLTEDLKARVAEAARREGLSTHAFMVQAIEQRAAQLEAQQEFLRTAQRRLAQWQRSGESLGWADVRQYVLDRAAGRKAERPQPRQPGGQAPIAEPQRPSKRASKRASGRASGRAPA